MIVALLTDFGTRDHYVGTMKAVVLSVCPETTLVDITHDIPPQDIQLAALELQASCRYFPAGTVFLVVVDPGVGSPRRAIAVDAGGYRFVGPDNGVLSLAVQDAGPAHVVELREEKYARPPVSRTFEGRDRFAPAAGWLARGIELALFGPSVADPIALALPRPMVVGGGIQGEVMRIDRFGNLITNIDRATLEAVGAALEVQVRGGRLRLVETYAQVQPGDLCALVGSSGHLEIAVNGGSAAERLGATRREPVQVYPSAGDAA